MICPTCKSHYAQGAFCANDGSALVADDTVGLVGKVLAERYRIVRLLGEGGMGQVYEAHHVNINKRFALKLLRSEVVGSQQSLARFRQEAWAASSIGHENIVEIDDFATLPTGEVYLAMEFLDGQSLAERLRDGPPLSLGEALPLLAAVGHGLSAAHDKGIVHRDMKPENIFLARRGARLVAKILDFGIAKVTGSDEPSTLTRTGAIFGTPLYMSPEQARGKPADARADVYALGVILYEVATGSVPFGGGSSVEILSQHIGATPVRPSELAPERNIPPALEALILRALAKEPEERQQSMGELVRELEAVAATVPAPERPERADRSDGSGARPLPVSRPVAQVHPMATPSQPMSARPATPLHPTATPAPAHPVGSPSRPVAAVHPVATPSQPFATRPPALPAGAAPPRRDATPSANPPVTQPPPSTTLDAVALPGRGRGRLYGALAAALVLLAGVLVLLWPRQGAPPAPPVTVAPPATPPEPAPAPTPPATPPPVHEVILDSVPPGAKILRDGAVVGETPDALALTAPTRVLLQKDGFADKWFDVDPGVRKQLVRLERAKSARPAPGARPAPAAAKPGPAGAVAAGAAAKPKPNDAPLEPYSARPTTAAPAPPTRPAAAASKPAAPARPAARDEVGARVDKQAASAAPGAHRVGEIYKGSAPEEGGRSDWYVELAANKCYLFVGEGGDGVKGLYLYLWGPNGKRVTDKRGREDAHPQMPYCTTAAGKYHFQAKISDGGGEYRVGIYQR